ncbi:MAG: PspC domain-containing protein, partial [Actinomycetota bacterium]|nr:PspC domain-containing protein [Actinomycetota bacterium]
TPDNPNRITRDPAAAMLGGVCAGLARKLGVDPIVIRVGAVVLAIGTSGIAAIGYLLAWALLPAAGAAESGPGARRRRRRGSWRIAGGVALLALSVLLGFRELGIWWSDALVWPLVLAAFGVALLWGLSRPATEQAAERPERGDAGRVSLLEPEAEPAPGEAARRFSRAGFGIALVLGAALLFLWSSGVLDAAGDTALAALVVTIALVLISAPFWWGLVRRLTVERSARIRSQERAEVAAHLHDSVLQTLALVQRRSDDPTEVAKLARRQERELRSWLAGSEQPRPGERLADALRGVAEQVEETHGAIVEAVVVGDAPLDDGYEALVGATREALTNAAKFAAEGGPVRLYAEIEDGGAGVWVDDRGPGFDPEDVPADRRGVRESIIGRMKRHGGSAEIRSGPEGGTEVELKIEGNGR